MFTSNYAKNANSPSAVSIAGRCPEWYKGVEYKKLAPKYWFFKAYKDGVMTSEEYTKHYHNEVLKPLNAKQVYDELVSLVGEGVTLLCWEKSGVFCHRRIVAEWFERELGLTINEV